MLVNSVLSSMSSNKLSPSISLAKTMNTTLLLNCSNLTSKSFHCRRIDFLAVQPGTQLICGEVLQLSTHLESVSLCLWTWHTLYVAITTHAVWELCSQCTYSVSFHRLTCVVISDMCCHRMLAHTCGVLFP